MLRQFCKKVFSLERSGTNIQRCLRANYCSNLGQDEPELADTDDHENALQKEFSFCHVSLLGRVGNKPTLVETSNSSFVSFVIGVDPAKGGRVKWHEVNVNSNPQKKQILRDIDVGDRVYLTGRLSYTQEEDYNKKYKIYSDFIRVVSHPQKYWEQRLGSEGKEADDSY